MLRSVTLLLVLIIQAKSSTLTDLLESQDQNDKPIIGIVTGNIMDLLSTEVDPETFYKNYQSYISRNYVQILHAHGARVIPIHYNAPFEKIRPLLHKINGLMMIGGGEDNDHYLKSRKIYNYVKFLNEQGNVVPILGICLGMQYVMMAESIDGVASMEFHMSWNENRDLDFMVNPKDTVQFGHYSWPELKQMATEELFYNSHWYGFDPDFSLEDFGMHEELRLTSKSESVWGDFFVSSIEGKRLPLLGIIYHVEKPGKNFQPLYMQHLNHSEKSIELIRRQMVPFVSLARKSKQNFGGYRNELQYLIENTPDRGHHNYVGMAYLYK